MKINKIIFGATAMLTMGMLASCSNDEPAPGNGNEQGGATRYMAVRIQSVPDLGGRGDQSAEGNDKFETGDGNESNVTADKLRFFFFDASGNPYQVAGIIAEGNTATTNMVTPTKVEPTETNGKPTGSTGVLVLNIPEGKVAVPPAKVVCVANIDWAAETSQYENKSLSVLETLTHNTPSNITEDSDFAMTTSTYYDGGIVNYTDITGKLETTPEAAKANPAEIYLERLAVKIRPNAANFTQSYKVMRSENGQITEDEFVFNQDGNTINLEVELTGWAPYNTAEKAYSLKSINAAWNTTAPFPGWNNAGLHRCYWAQVPTLNYENTSYSIESNDGFSTGTWYTYENTNLQSNTKMIVRGVVYMKGDDTKTGIDFVKWGGYFYTTEKFIDLVAADQDVADKSTIELVEDETLANTYKVQINGEDVNAFTGIYWWKDGVTSYVVDIEHLDDSKAIVRNHIYEYTFRNIIGLGIPGDEPVQPTQTDTYLAAKIYVLNWRLVPHTITLE